MLISAFTSKAATLSEKIDSFFKPIVENYLVPIIFWDPIKAMGFDIGASVPIVVVWLVFGAIYFTFKMNFICFFLNMFYGGQLKAMPTKLKSDNGKHIVIRPLSYSREKDIAEFHEFRVGMAVPIQPIIFHSRFEYVLWECRAAPLYEIESFARVALRLRKPCCGDQVEPEPVLAQVADLHAVQGSGGVLVFAHCQIEVRKSMPMLVHAHRFGNQFE